MNSETSSVRQHILDIARPIILGKGFSAVGLSEILAAAAVPKGSFYHYFTSKDAFGVALLQSYFSQYLAELDELLADDGSPAAERLMRYWQRWSAGQCVNPGGKQCLVVKLAGEVCDLSEAMHRTLAEGSRAVVQRLAQCIVEGQQDGSLPGGYVAADRAETLYQMWLGSTLYYKIQANAQAIGLVMQATRQLLGLDTEDRAD